MDLVIFWHCWLYPIVTTGIIHINKIFQSNKDEMLEILENNEFSRNMLKMLMAYLKTTTPVDTTKKKVS